MDPKKALVAANDSCIIHLRKTHGDDFTHGWSWSLVRPSPRFHALSLRSLNVFFMFSFFSKMIEGMNKQHSAREREREWERVEKISLNDLSLCLLECLEWSLWGRLRGFHWFRISALRSNEGTQRGDVKFSLLEKTIDLGFFTVTVNGTRGRDVWVYIGYDDDSKMLLYKINQCLGQGHNYNIYWWSILWVKMTLKCSD